tara:strand:- start:40 stop:609 length:570 start_codon:yes stop_codon:yes gene_type:complete
LGIEYESVAVEFYPSKEHKSAWFKEINPLGQLPVIDDDDFRLRDAQAILVYIATQYDSSGNWYPSHDASQTGEIAQWLSFADSLTATISSARLATTFFFDFDLEKCQTDGHKLLRILDEHLWFQEQQQLEWICRGGHPSLAEIACFPYVALSEEGGISRQEYAAVRRWTDRVKRIPGFIGMPGIFPAGS